MLSNVFFKTVYDMRQGILTWSLIFFGLSVMMLAFWPSIEESQGEYEEMIQEFPEEFLGLFGGEVDLSSLEGYLALELFSFFYPFMVLAFTVVNGAGLLADEEDSGSLDVLLATPIPRWRVYLEKFLALCVYTAAVMIASFLGLVAGALLFGQTGDLDLGLVLAASTQLALLGIFFGALALMITGVQGARGPALGITLAVAAVTYLLFTMAETANIPEALTWLSPWFYYDGSGVVREGITIGYTAVLMGATALSVWAGIVAFQRRDVGT